MWKKIKKMLQLSIEMTKNRVYHNRTKHIAIKYHFLREATNDKQIDLKHINQKYQLADIFTKALLIPRFEALQEKLGIIRMSINGVLKLDANSRNV